MKCYLAKSKKGHQDLISACNTVLKEERIEILEQEAGYDPNIINGADFVIVVPPFNDFNEEFQAQQVVGKGLYSEIKGFMPKPVFAAIKTTTGCFFKEVKKVDEYNTKDWHEQYGILTLGTTNYHNGSDLAMEADRIGSYIKEANAMDESERTEESITDGLLKDNFFEEI